MKNPVHHGSVIPGDLIGNLRWSAITATDQLYSGMVEIYGYHLLLHRHLWLQVMVRVAIMVTSYGYSDILQENFHMYLNLIGLNFEAYLY